MIFTARAVDVDHESHDRVEHALENHGKDLWSLRMTSLIRGPPCFLPPPRPVNARRPPNFSSPRKKTAPTIINTILANARRHHPPADEYLSPEEQLRRVREELDRDEDVDSSVSDGSIARPKFPQRRRCASSGNTWASTNSNGMPSVLSLLLASIGRRIGGHKTLTDSVEHTMRKVKEEYPEARRFRGPWGIDRVAKRYWDGRKSYIRDLKNPDS
ncbi:hypothetical protein GGX14DRAFT_396841 [Mycena pura]|uniref:Uncharacterized protein n=1 Tax=Mycena pura TaxID=153505 RepID=A0AAD6VA23_9AGAR|nr:hypothetical protein GGX14DRAFT_396841 [Mycena pura]